MMTRYLQTSGLDLNKATMAEVYKKFGLEPGTQDFIGHALALELDDAYMTKPAKDTYERICLYMNSMARYGKSPYIYPMYGLGELPQGFARYVFACKSVCVCVPSTIRYVWLPIIGWVQSTVEHIC